MSLPRYRSSHYGMQYDVNYGQPPTQQLAMAQEPQRYGMGYKLTVEPVISRTGPAS